MSSSKKIILSKPSDWDSWLSFVRTRAQSTRIWDLVNSELWQRPDFLVEPYEPEYAMPDDDNDFDRQSFAAYKARKEIYKGQMDKFER